MPDPPVTFAAYAGSLRKGSYNKMLLDALARVAPPNIRVNVLDISEIPLFNMDHEAHPPEPVRRMREAIRTADGLIIVSPEHNGIVPAATKNIIEWASRPPDDSVLEGKPVAVIGASTGGFGTIKAQLNIRQIATVEGVYFLQEPEVRVARVHTKFNEAGELTDDDLKEQLLEFLDAFARWAKKIGN